DLGDHHRLLRPPAVAAAEDRGRFAVRPRDACAGAVTLRCDDARGMEPCERVRHSHRQSLAISLLMLGMALASGDLLTQSVGPGDMRQVGTKRMVTQGLAKMVNENLFKCEVELRNYRISAVGTIAADNGTVLTVPAQTAYQTGPKLADLFNECSKTTPAKLADASLENVPVVEIDPDGEVITGYVVADNYFELYVNGKLIGVDPIPFTPFNSAIVRFKANRAYTYALKAVDWEARLGLGMETNRGTDWHAGDGGLIARFSDGTVTAVPGKRSPSISRRWQGPTMWSKTAASTTPENSDACTPSQKHRHAATNASP